VKEVRSFLSHVRFYRHFIKDFSYIANPLKQLLAKDILLMFTDECLQAFEKINEAFMWGPTIQPLDWSLPFKLMCDVSDYGVTMVLGEIGRKSHSGSITQARHLIRAN